MIISFKKNKNMHNNFECIILFFTFHFPLLSNILHPSSFFLGYRFHDELA